MENSKFISISINTWRQIEAIDIGFHKRLTILTGANGTGKTTILNILGNHFGWNTTYVATPKREKTGILKWFTDFWQKPSKIDTFKYKEVIGEIKYTNTNISELSIPSIDKTYNVGIEPKYIVKGLHIPSHRPIYQYSPVNQIPTQPILSEQAFSNYKSFAIGNQHGTYQTKPNHIIKETLLSLATYGYGNDIVIANPKAKELFERFQKVLKFVLPPKLGFQKIKIEMPEVLLVTRSGEFALDSVSGGLASILDIVWQIFMYEADNKNFVVTLDEPENHLHPEMQQTLLNGLLDAFPSVQFIVATHNPFIITSVPDSNVYVLDYNNNNKVESHLLDFVNKAGTANEVLRDVLGLPFTMPIWAEEKLQKIIKKYSEIEITNNSLGMLRKELSEIGLEDSVPDTIVKIIERQEND